MMMLAVPGDTQLLQAVGEVAILHGHLDYILRVTIKTVADVSLQQALDATARAGSAANN